MHPADEIFYKSVVLILQGWLAGDESTSKIFHSADWRAAVNNQAELIKKQGSVDSTERGLVSESDDSSKELFLRLIVSGPTGGKQLLKDVKRWLRTAREVIICDPYIMYSPKSGIYQSDEHYIEFIAGLIPTSAKIVKFFGNGYKAEIRNKINSALKKGRKVSFTDTNEIHDRYIVKDLSEARMLGTSFGGIGNKIFTALDLPQDDLTILKGHLWRIENRRPTDL